MSHFTEWTIGHVHSGALGWNALVTFGTFYFLGAAPRGPPALQHAARQHCTSGSRSPERCSTSCRCGPPVFRIAAWLSLDELGEVRYSFVDVMRACSLTICCGSRGASCS